MKKILIVMAIAILVSLIGCDNGTTTPTPEYTVYEGTFSTYTAAQYEGVVDKTLSNILGIFNLVGGATITTTPDVTDLSALLSTINSWDDPSGGVGGLGGQLIKRKYELSAIVGTYKAYARYDNGDFKEFIIIVAE
jgi:hypothetical protein